MASTLSSIGFRVQTEEAMTGLLRQAVAQGVTRFDVPGGAYWRWSGGGGEELWLQMRLPRTVIGYHPHFSGRSEVAIEILSRVQRPAHTFLDGAYSCWARPGQDGDDGEYPFIFDCPDSKRHGDMELPIRGVAQVAAFASRVVSFPSIEAYEQSTVALLGETPAADSTPSVGITMASKSFVPIGMFQVDPAAPPLALADFRGHVVDTAVKMNALTGDEFVWALVESLGGSYDVVIDPRIVSDRLAPGNVIVGSFWLSGRIRSTTPSSPW